MPSAEQITTAMATIDQLSNWLDNTGLSAAAIAQFKFNALAAMYPELREVAELAKQLIGATSPVPEVGMGATELAQVLKESLNANIKAEQVNQALVALGYQERNAEKRIWLITETGSNYGTAILATSTTNKWQGSQVKWYRSVIPKLEEYFRNAANSVDQADSKDGAAIATQDESPTNKSNSSTKTKKVFTVAERAKELGYKALPEQLQLIQSFADESYKEEYGSQPPRVSGRKTPVSKYPIEFIDSLDRAIEKVFNPKKKSQPQ
ncbi:hypothetical protein IQ264_29625 [Phormidium sp. LEGE 05292]|uniref:hypothetical protein n=1 Tax=[Phormidium] sp. LEGE 05292 TaxID=767427 RepID=UPI001882C58E|nr:hypothetical protein [Phormidium sp. LEGE 05292]MBE9229570.1 hypothetical protein [Phormidium sp. LEGE 05292]